VSVTRESLQPGTQTAPLVIYGIPNSDGELSPLPLGRSCRWGTTPASRAPPRPWGAHAREGERRPTRVASRARPGRGSARGDTVFTTIIGLLADRQRHNVRELGEVTRYPDEQVRELTLEGRVDVSTEATSSPRQAETGAPRVAMLRAESDDAPAIGADINAAVQAGWPLPRRPRRRAQDYCGISPSASCETRVSSDSRARERG
jgi:hypothetical protein